jgi:hypothetical protein
VPKSQTSKERVDSLNTRCLIVSEVKDEIQEEFDAHARQAKFNEQQCWIQACDSENPALMCSKAGAVIGTLRLRLAQAAVTKLYGISTALHRINNLCCDRQQKGIGYDEQLHEIVMDALKQVTDA